MVVAGKSGAGPELGFGISCRMSIAALLDGRRQLEPLVRGWRTGVGAREGRVEGFAVVVWGFGIVVGCMDTGSPYRGVVGRVGLGLSSCRRDTRCGGKQRGMKLMWSLFAGAQG